MRAWYLSDPAQECSLAILEGELGCRVLVGDVAGGMQLIDELELSEEHLGAAFGDTVKVSGIGDTIQCDVRTRVWDVMGCTYTRVDPRTDRQPRTNPTLSLCIYINT